MGEIMCLPGLLAPLWCDDVAWVNAEPRSEMSDPRGAQRLLIQENRAPGRNFEMYMPDQTARIFVDGIAGVTGGSAVSHLDFFVTTEVRPDSDPALGFRETRQIILRIAVPTAQLLEGLANLVAALSPQLDSLIAAAQQNAEMIARQADRLR
jgi:hypothetical protein